MMKNQRSQAASVRWRLYAVCGLLGAIFLMPLTGPAGAQAADADDDRLGYIQRALEAEQPEARRWWWGWVTTFSVSTVALATASLLVDDEGIKRSGQVGAGSSAVGLVATLLVPCPARYAADAVRSMPEGSPSEREAKLRRAERLLEYAARQEAFGESIWAHVGSLLVSGTAGAVLYFAYDQPEAAARNLGVGVLVGQLRIHTLPDRLPDVHRGYPGGQGSRVARARWGFLPTPGGVMVGGVF